MQTRVAPVVVASMLFAGFAVRADAGGQKMSGPIHRNPAPSKFSLTGQVSPPSPFSNLFRPRSPVRPTQPAPAPAQQFPGTPSPQADPSLAPRVVCGMTLVPVDPQHDAAIRKQAPMTPKPSVRAVPPPPCER